MTPPAYSLPCWADDRQFYVQLPGPNGPVTIGYSLENISKALPLFQGHFAKVPHPKAIPARVERPESDAVRSVLRRMGVMG